MKIAYFDVFSGISGDMIIGAFIDAGLDFKYLKLNLKKLKLPEYELDFKKVEKNSISGTKFNVSVSNDNKSRNLKEIVDIINSSSLSEYVKNKSSEIFTRLAEVEAKIHYKEINNVYFHEVGAIDSIIDIVGAVIACEFFEIEKIYCSKINIGAGFINSMHGKIPVPSPATAALLKNVPVNSSAINSELTTPTGAAIITCLSEDFGKIPEFIYERIGYGAGFKNFDIPNLLRVFIGELSGPDYLTDNVVLLETNIDDMNPEFYKYLFDKLLNNGALDVYLIPVIMKKSRPGNILNVITEINEMDKLSDLIFMETTSSGIRINHINRKKLNREIKTIDTEYGSINIKINRSKSKIMTISPEYDDCESIARETGRPLKEIYNKAREIAQKKFEM